MRNTATVFLQANKEYHITIEIRNNIVRYIVNGDLFFEYNDPFVLQEGFGFRSTKSRQAIAEIRVYQPD